MNVKELIEKLQKFDPELQVRRDVGEHDSWLEEVCGVEEVMEQEDGEEWFDLDCFEDAVDVEDQECYEHVVRIY